MKEELTKTVELIQDIQRKYFYSYEKKKELWIKVLEELIEKSKDNG